MPALAHDQQRVNAPVRLGDLRASLGADAHRRDDRRVYRDLARDLAIYVTTVAGAVAAPTFLLRMLCGLAAGLAVTALFVWAHDAAHGAILGGGRRATVLGTIAMLPSLQPYRLWQHGHNRVHHGFTSLTTIDWIWRPWAPAAYAAAGPMERLGYRMERSLLGCGLHYLRRVWWAGMVRFRPSTPGQARDRRVAWAITGVWAAAAAAVVAYLGGPAAVLSAILVPWLVFTYAIAFITYVHHTHPTRHFYGTKAEWDPVRGHVTGSTVTEVPRVVAWFLHDIFVHTPHHLDTRIPYHQLRPAWRDLEPAVAGLDVLRYRLTPASLRSTFRACKLFDYGTGSWQRFPVR